jgi:hypothetical protein
MHGVPRCGSDAGRARPQRLPGLPRPGEALPPQARKRHRLLRLFLRSRPLTRGRCPRSAGRTPAAAPDPPWALSLLRGYRPPYPWRRQAPHFHPPYPPGDLHRRSRRCLPSLSGAQHLWPRPGVLAAGLRDSPQAPFVLPTFQFAQTGGTHRAAPHHIVVVVEDRGLPWGNRALCLHELQMRLPSR